MLFRSSDADTVQVSFNESPVAGVVTEICDVANENYTVTIPISGGLAPYTINGNAIAGNNYISAPIMNGVLIPSPSAMPTAAWPRL